MDSVGQTHGEVMVSPNLGVPRVRSCTNRTGLQQIPWQMFPNLTTAMFDAGLHTNRRDAGHGHSFAEAKASQHSVLSLIAMADAVKRLPKNPRTLFDGHYIDTSSSMPCFIVAGLLTKI